MHYLLDTNIFIAALKAQPAVRLRLESLPASAVVLSPIVLGELQTGVEKSAQAERNRARLDEVVAAAPDIGLQPGDKIAVDFDTGVITNLTRNESYQGEPFPAFIQGIISAGGLMNAIKTGKL